MAAGSNENVDRVLTLLQGVKRSGDTGRQWVALCPAHDDAKHSLAIGVGKDGRVLLKCYAGCTSEAVVAAVGLTMADLFAEKPENKAITLGELAFDKRLPAKWLHEKCGLEDKASGRGGVGIPYYDEKSKRLLVKTRAALVAKDGSFWPKGQKLLPYGLWMLPDFRKQGKTLILVEGESDCWTLWFHGFPGFGLPGADAARTLTAEALEGFDTVLVWREPGQSGDTFIDGVAHRLIKLGWSGRSLVISSVEVKDPNDMHKRDPEGFPAAFRAIMEKAWELPAPSKEHEKNGKAHKKPLPVPGVVTATKEEPAPDSQPPLAPGFFGLTDYGNAQRLAHYHGRDLKFCHSWGKWLIWSDSHWSADSSAEVYRRLALTIRSIYSEAAACEDKDLRQKLGEHAHTSDGIQRAKGAVEWAKSLPGIPVSPENLDTDQWKLNLLNGTLDLKTGELMAHRRENLLTKIAKVVFDPKAKCPRWLAFLDQIMGGKADLIEFLRLAVGYSLTGDVREKCFFFLYGSGDNGKSTFIELLADLLGDYWSKTTADMVLAKKYGSAIPNDVARLVGIRLVSTAELPENRSLDEAKVKDLTGQDTISARFLHGEWFDFRPVFKLWMYGNHKPTIRGADDGIWKRVRLIPFSVTIPKAEQDVTLKEKLRAELPGILNWALAGCLQWQKTGLPAPAAVTEATDDYRSEMDVLAAFLNDRCVISNDRSTNVLSSVLYEAYSSWSKHSGEEPLSQRAFGMKLKARGFKQSRTDKSRFWMGLDIAQEESAGQSGRSGLAAFDD